MPTHDSPGNRALLIYRRTHVATPVTSRHDVCARFAGDSAPDGMVLTAVVPHTNASLVTAPGDVEPSAAVVAEMACAARFAASRPLRRARSAHNLLGGPQAVTHALNDLLDGASGDRYDIAVHTVLDTHPVDLRTTVRSWPAGNATMALLLEVSALAPGLAQQRYAELPTWALWVALRMTDPTTERSSGLYAQLWIRANALFD
jgi:hypothetical protein